MSVSFPRPVPWRAQALLVVVVRLLAACGMPLISARTASQTEQVATDSGKFTATYRVTSGGVALSQDEVVGRARTAAGDKAEYLTPDARRVLLTLQAENDEIVTIDRDAWLVTYPGLSFEPEVGCECYVNIYANTTIVLDAVKGDVLFVFGSGPQVVPAR